MSSDIMMQLVTRVDELLYKKVVKAATARRWSVAEWLRALVEEEVGRGSAEVGGKRKVVRGLVPAEATVVGSVSGEAVEFEEVAGPVEKLSSDELRAAIPGLVPGSLIGSPTVRKDRTVEAEVAYDWDAEGARWAKMSDLDARQAEIEAAIGSIRPPKGVKGINGLVAWLKEKLPRGPK